MIETAIRLTEGQITATDIQQILGFIREMLQAPVELLDHAADVVATLSRTHSLMLITKGDLFDQERKLARSGLNGHFARVEIVGDKAIDVYRALLAKHQLDAGRFLMVGDSLRSDILPVVALGGHAVYIPYHTTSAHGAMAAQEETLSGYIELGHIGLLPAYVEQLGQGGGRP